MTNVLAEPLVPLLEAVPTVISAVDEPPASPVMSSVPGLLVLAHFTSAVDLFPPIKTLLARRILVPVPRLSTLLAVPATGLPATVAPGVGAPSPMSMIGAVTVLLAARLTVALTVVPTPTANMFPPEPGGMIVAPLPVVKVKLDKLLMSSVG